MSDRIKAIRESVETIHQCTAVHVQSVPVREVFREVTVWEGVVEVFDITGHPKAKRCYAWRVGGAKDQYDFTAVLELPPVKDPITAVRASIMAQRAPGGAS